MLMKSFEAIEQKDQVVLMTCLKQVQTDSNLVKYVDNILVASTVLCTVTPQSKGPAILLL